MLIEDITEFLPKYPNINNYEEEDLDFLNTYDDNFNLSIFKKKEFNENILEPYEDSPKKGELYMAQKTISRFFSSRTPYDSLLLLWEMGTGKCHKIDTPIIMSNGQIKMVQDIQVGETLMGDDSTPRIVTSLARGEDEMYQIIPLDGGDTYVVNQEHILCLKVPTYPSIYYDDSGYVIEWIQDNKFMSKKYILTYDTILDKLEKERCAIEFKLKINWEQILEIEVKDYLNLPQKKQKLLKVYRVPVHFKKQKVEVDSYYFGYNLLSTEEKYNFSCVPNNYKFNSINNRLNLLAGLIDSNGVFKNNSFEISYLINKEIIFNDIIYVARSLGFTSYKKENNTIVIKGRNLLKIPIKSLFSNLHSYKDTEDNLLSSIKVKHVGRDNYYGFTLNGNCRYLLGDFSVTHNTCAAVGAIEQIRKENSSIKGAIILASGPGLLLNFKNELVNKCTKDNYIPKEFVTAGEKIRRINKLVKEYYNFDYTFYGMAKEISKFSDDVIIQKYSNKIIVIDEVHNIRLKDKKIKVEQKIDVYFQLHRLLHLVKNCKILLMSGTPIQDKITEFPDIMNLILPLNNQLKIKQDFINEYFTFDETIPILQRQYTLKEDGKIKLKNIMKGKISYLKSMSYQIKKKFNGDKNVGTLKNFIVYKTLMSSFQSNVYIPTIDKKEDIEEDNSKNNNYYINSRQASLFVFPDKTYGSDGFNKWITKENISSLLGKKGKKTKYALNEALKKSIIVKDDEKKSLSNLRKYSSIYADTIENILRATNEGKSSFVYCSLVTGSGAILFSLILELFGYSSTSVSTELSPKKRYTLFTNDNKDHIPKIIAEFNHPKNLHGEYINVIIGSEIISEGYSFKNIQEIHILSPFWNYAETAQAIARGYRAGSHKDLINEEILKTAHKNGINTNNYFIEDKQGNKNLDSAKLSKDINFTFPNININIYQYASIPIKEIKKGETEPLYDLSIDIIMYKRSEIKDINIKQIERLIKESAFDCALNYKRNIRDDDFQSDCDYMECEYKCDNIPDNYYKNKNGEDFYAKDLSTFQLYYNDADKNKIKEFINKFFRENFQIELLDLFSKLPNYSHFEILDVLRELITNNVIIYDKYNLPRYLRENNNIYFLVDNMIVEGDYLLSYYTENPILNSNISFESIFNFYVQKATPNIIKSISTCNDDKKFANLLDLLPKDIKSFILEKSIIAKIKNIQTDFRDKILEFYKYSINDLSSITDDRDKLFYINSLDINNLRCLKNKEKGWENCSDDDKKIYFKSKKEKKDDIKNPLTNPYGYYGKINPGTENIAKQDTFCLGEIDTSGEKVYDVRKLKPGKVCKSYGLPTLIYIISCKIKIPIPKDISFKGTIDDKKNKIRNYTKFDKVFNNEEKKNNFNETTDEDEIDRILFWKEKKMDEICNAIKEFLISKNLLFDDVKCGESTGPRT